MTIPMTSAVWILNFIHADMLRFGEQLEEPVAELEPVADHMTHTTRCLLNYAYVNDVDVESAVMGDAGYIQAKATWELIHSNYDGGVQQGRDIVERYSDRSYIYCIVLWNSAYQILLNQPDVYNDTFGDFIEGMEKLSNGELTFGDERTQPLFMLISQLSR